MRRIYGTLFLRKFPPERDKNYFGVLAGLTVNISERSIAMECRIEDFRYKEVVNVCNGHRLGFVCDAIIDVGTGQVLALVVPGRCKFLGIFWREDDYIFPWDCIKRIGSDIVLVDIPGEYRRGKRERHPRFKWEFAGGENKEF